MALPRELTGTTYVDMWRRMRKAFADENQLVLVDDPTHASTLGDAYVPEVSNAQAIGIVTAWNRAGARGNVPDDEWKAWGRVAQRLMQWALGWMKLGDRFVMTEAQARAPLAHGLSLLWLATFALAQTLDANRTVVRAVPLETSYAAYEAGAREAWNVMQTQASRDRECDACLPPPFETDPACDECAEKPAPDTGGSGWGWLLLLGLGAYAYSQSSR